MKQKVNFLFDLLFQNKFKSHSSEKLPKVENQKPVFILFLFFRKPIKNRLQKKLQTDRSYLNTFNKNGIEGPKRHPKICPKKRFFIEFFFMPANDFFS
jgi:hypothetical protein